MTIIRKFQQLFEGETLKYLNSISFQSKKKIILLIILQLIISSFNVIIVIISKSIIDTATSQMTSKSFFYVAIIALTILFQLALSSFFTIYVTRLRESMRNKFQYEQLQYLLHKDWLHLNQLQTGDLQVRMTNDINNVIDIWITTIPNIITLIFSFIIAFAVLAYYDILLAILTFIISPFAIIITWYIGSKLKKHQYNIQNSESKLVSYLNDIIKNFIIVKTFEVEETTLNKTDKLQTDRYNLINRKIMLQTISQAILTISYRLSFFLTLLFGAFRLSNATITFGTFTAFLQLVNMVQAPIQGITKSITKFMTSYASVDRIKELEDLQQGMSHHSVDSFQQLSFKDVCFMYDNEQVLNHLSLVINKGDKIVITGSSGEGKTTFIRLLLSLIQHQSGHIHIHTQTGSQLIDVNLRKLSSYVSQKNLLFTGSIRENLTLNQTNLSDQSLFKVLEIACCDFVTDLNQVISARNTGFSEGQLQRLCIARALVRNKEILVLDEATSSLDFETEEKLIQNILTHYNHLTIISITHREHTIMKFNYKYRMINGQLKSFT